MATTTKERLWVSEQRPEVWRPRDWTYEDDYPAPEGLTAADKLLRVIAGDPRITGSSYAWGKTARAINERDLILSFENTTGFFYALDICSAFPIWPQIIREMYKDRCHDEGVKVAEETIWEISRSQDFSKEFVVNFLQLFTDPETRPRRSLHAIIENVLSKPLESANTQSCQEREEVLAETFLLHFKQSLNIGNRLYTKRQLREIKFPDTFMERMTTMDKLIRPLTDPETHDAFMDQFSALLAKKCLPLMVDFRVFSLDNRSYQEIAVDARRSFPEEMVDTDFFYDAGQFTGHYQADIFALPFLPNSISFISCIEGYPFHFPSLPLGVHENKVESHLVFANVIARVLKPGGRAVFFPWITKEDSERDRQNLSEVEDYWAQKGMRIQRRRYDLAKLEDQMGDREKMLTFVSPIFETFRTHLDSLTVEKPRAS